MNNKNLSVLSFSAIAMVSLSLLNGCISTKNTPTPSPSLAIAWTAAPTSICPAQTSWVTDPSLPTEVASGQSNCAFHQFMWQSLLALVQPTATHSNVREFETWMPSYGMFVGEGQQPTPWGTVAKPDFCQSASASAVAANHIFSDLTLQAGSHHPLIDQNLTPVFYNVSVNRPAYDFITGCDLYKAQCSLTLAPDRLQPSTMAVVNIPKDYPTLAFPNGSIELKTSWKVLTNAEQQSQSFYTTTGSVQAPGQSCLENVVLGLVGIHIVSKTATHPEFIWATFEHKNNAPDCSAPNAKPPLAGEWTFYDQNCQGDCTTNEYTEGQVSQVCRMHPWGDPTIGTFPNGLDCNSTPPPGYICDLDTQKYVIEPNTANLIAINESVTSLLQSLPAGNDNRLWANYALVGNIWTANGILPPDLQVQRGSLSDANTTMETYVQNGVANVTNPASCFSCHNLVGKTATSSDQQATEPAQLPPAGLSHIFNLLDINTTGCNNGTALPVSVACPLTLK